VSIVEGGGQPDSIAHLDGNLVMGFTPLQWLTSQLGQIERRLGSALAQLELLEIRRAEMIGTGIAFGLSTPRKLQELKRYHITGKHMESLRQEICAARVRAIEIRERQQRLSRPQPEADAEPTQVGREMLHKVFTVLERELEQEGRVGRAEGEFQNEATAGDNGL